MGRAANISRAVICIQSFFFILCYDEAVSMRKHSTFSTADSLLCSLRMFFKSSLLFLALVISFTTWQIACKDKGIFLCISTACCTHTLATQHFFVNSTYCRNNIIIHIFFSVLFFLFLFIYNTFLLPICLGLGQFEYMYLGSFVLTYYT